MGMLFSEDIRNNIECLLFVACEPLSVEKLMEITGAARETVMVLLDELAEHYQERGFQLMEVAGGWQFATRPACADMIEKYYRPKIHSLSKAALETLAIIAYRQPVTRTDIETIRGVKVDGVVSTLLEKNLIQDVGRKNGPGRPVLYGTTMEFLKFFGLKSLQELPDPDQLSQDPPNPEKEK
ncbi:SMC-Scp complex subunit ScpB [Dehalobacterium formicoaceticum]|uniref:Segregation and condensation protein B n=1 Tax=Dehalobacterium formicoaceticum TaxID=51515 RepID=A0ABT1Y7G2_9FIRM|nr:SMC-Scp complex subunit ScpB [Dehalobacterium formicoaceticum]MCR6545844.1 SMC-Scp complex subunit ScpB [Dehalobacterium formicoaceticum]